MLRLYIGILGQGLGARALGAIATGPGGAGLPQRHAQARHTHVLSGPVVSDPTLAHTAWDLLRFLCSKFTLGRPALSHICKGHPQPFFQLQNATSCDTSREESKPIVLARGLMASGLRFKCLCLGPLLFLFRLLLQALPPLEPNHQEPIRRGAMLPRRASRHHQRDGWQARKGAAFAQ